MGSITPLCMPSRLAMELGERRTETGGGLTGPAALNRALTRLRAEHHAQAPALTIAIQTDPPASRSSSSSIASSAIN